MPTSSKSPGYPAYVRIEKILRTEAFLAKRLSAPSIPILRTGGQTTEVSPEVAAVVVHLGRKGFSASDASRETVIAAATEVLKTPDFAKVYLSGDDAPTTPPPTAAPTKPKAVAAAKPKSAPAKPKAAKAAKPATSAAPEPPAKAAEVPPSDSGVSKKKVRPPEATPVTPVRQPKAAASTSDSAASGLPSKRTHDHLCSYMVGVVSLLMSAEQIMNAHDRFPGHDRRSTGLSEIIRECQRYVEVPAK